jgi:hypothetical protein
VCLCVYVCHPGSTCKKCDMMIKVSSLTRRHFNAAHNSFHYGFLILNLELVMYVHV